KHSLSARAFKPLRDLFQYRFGGDVFRFSLEVAQQAMPQACEYRIVDIVVTDADSSLEQSVDFCAKDDRLGAAGTGAESQILRNLGTGAGTSRSACGDNRDDVAL